MSTNKISCSFFIAPSRCQIFIDAVKTLQSCSIVPNQISAYFNPTKESEELEQTIKFCADNDIETFKFNSFNSLSKVWNLSIRNSNSPYHLICNDDIIFENPKSIDMILQKHSEGHHMVKGAEAFSAFSISKRLVNTVGYFDENFVWSWEDADYRLRMSKMGIVPFEIIPNPIKHLRCPSDRNEEYWNKSSEYFFNKWNISKLLVDLKILESQTLLDADQRKYLLFNGFFGDEFYKNYGLNVELNQEKQ